MLSLAYARGWCSQMFAFIWIGKVKNYIEKPGTVAHACNPSYWGGKDQEVRSLKPAWANSLWDPISKNPSQKGLMEWLKVLALSSNPRTTHTQKHHLLWGAVFFFSWPQTVGIMWERALHCLLLFLSKYGYKGLVSVKLAKNIKRDTSFCLTKHSWFLNLVSPPIPIWLHCCVTLSVAKTMQMSRLCI
jgi:hypothetical protein